MEFPDDIREYSQPLTRPDWKRFHKLPQDELALQLFM